MMSLVHQSSTENAFKLYEEMDSNVSDRSFYRVPVEDPFIKQEYRKKNAVYAIFLFNFHVDFYLVMMIMRKMRTGLNLLNFFSN